MYIIQWTNVYISVWAGALGIVSTAAFHARARGSVPGLGGLNETKMFLPHPRVKLSIVGSLRDREVACSASDRHGSNIESCVWRTVSSHSSHGVIFWQFAEIAACLRRRFHTALSYTMQTKIINFTISRILCEGHLMSKSWFSSFKIEIIAYLTRKNLIFPLKMFMYAPQVMIKGWI